jgi:predicted ATPase
MEVCWNACISVDTARSAFPDAEWSAVDGQGKFQLHLSQPHVKRSFDASELSDGTLRFFCLCAALLTEKLPPFLVLNEPEASLHADLLEPLADLIAGVPESTQLLIVTHSSALPYFSLHWRPAPFPPP